nr:hypothetical protein [Natrialba sp. INN-245]
MKDFAVVKDVPLCEGGEPTFREPDCLDVEFFVRLEIANECSEELVCHKTTFVVRKAVFAGFVDLEGTVSPDDELSFFVHLPIQSPEAPGWLSSSTSFRNVVAFAVRSWSVESSFSVSMLLRC